MGKPSAPKPPDPAKVAGAQVAQNVSTALAQSTLNNVNQVTPDGSLTYSVDGYDTLTDPNTGQTYQIPRYTATQSLSEQGQALKGVNDAAGMNLATLARDQSARLGTLLGTPVDLSNDAVEGRLMELGRARLDPMLAQRQEGLRASLSAQGIKEGSAAYDRAMAREGQSQNDAYNQLLLTGRGQAVQEALTARNQPINEITALTSGSQVSQPSFVGTNPAQLANVDRAGLENQAYQQNLAAWQQNMANRLGIMGGAFGLGANAIMASDRRLKTDIRRVGTTDGGLPIFTYRYKAGGPVQMGVMAQDVLEVAPHAVHDIGGGFLGVDYAGVR